MTDANETTATVSDVREWGRANGYEVADKGRLSNQLKADFTEKTGKSLA